MKLKFILVMNENKVMFVVIWIDFVFIIMIIWILGRGMGICVDLKFCYFMGVLCVVRLNVKVLYFVLVIES